MGCKPGIPLIFLRGIAVFWTMECLEAMLLKQGSNSQKVTYIFPNLSEQVLPISDSEAVDILLLFLFFNWSICFWQWNVWKLCCSNKDPTRRKSHIFFQTCPNKCYQSLIPRQSISYFSFFFSIEAYVFGKMVVNGQHFCHVFPSGVLHVGTFCEYFQQSNKLSSKGPRKHKPYFKLSLRT